MDVKESSLSKKCLASEVQAKHCRLPPDLGKGPFALYRSLGYECQAASKFPGPRWRNLQNVNRSSVSGVGELGVR